MAEPVKSPWMSAKRTAGQTHWQSVTTLSNNVTRKVSYRTNSFVELGAGLNVLDTKGQFIAANPSFTITATGAEASGAAHQVIVPGDIGRGEGVRIITPKGEALVFQPLAVDYFDPVDGRGVLLDTVTNAIGWLVASNEIIFSNCFTHLKASIRLRNTHAGLESDLILHERPPDPESFGLSSFARLEMLTEQLEGVAPARRETVLREERDAAVRASMVEPDFVDTELSFNGMKMTVGKAFITPTPTNAAAPFLLPTRVGKTFLNLEGRRVLIEAVEHRRVREALNKLPYTTNSLQLRAGISPVAPAGRLATRTRSLPILARTSYPADKAIREARLAYDANSLTGPDQKSLLASATPAPAFVLDYYLLNEYGEHDFTFRSDTTYQVSTYILLTGTTTIEGGTVVKFNEAAGIVMFAEDSLICDTTNHLPAVFTCIDDNSVGEYLFGSGNPTQTGTYGFYFIGGTRELNNVRFTHLAYPVAVEGSGTPSQITLRNVQVVNAAYALDTGNTTMKVFNGLFKDCGVVFSGTGTFLGEHLTVDNTTLNPTTLGYASSATLKNSLLVAVLNPSGNIGSYAGVETVNPSSAAGLFQSVEGGGYYLANDAHRNVGTAAIDAQLRAVITNMTTYAPEVITGTLTTDRTLDRRAIRDTGELDRGYHYPAVDYLAKNLTVQNVTLTLRNGVVVAGGFNSSATWSPALHLNPGKLVSLGTPTRINHLFRANQVQENVQARAYTLLQDGALDSFKPEVTLRHTELSSLAGETYLFAIFSPATGRCEASHCRFVNGRSALLTLYGGGEQLVGFTNNLFRSTDFILTGYSPAIFSAYNNLFKDGSFSLAGGNAAWRIYDNVFDHAGVSDDASPSVGGKNAYVATASQLSFDATPLTLSSLSYASGPLGLYYIDGPTLENAGSRTAAAAGLYHHTTRPSRLHRE